jgi:hypothetical protein
MDVSKISAAMSQVSSFMSDKTSQGVLAAPSSDQSEGSANTSAVTKESSILSGGNSDAFKVSFSSAALSKNSILSAS